MERVLFSVQIDSHFVTALSLVKHLQTFFDLTLNMPDNYSVVFADC